MTKVIPAHGPRLLAAVCTVLIVVASVAGCSQPSAPAPAAKTEPAKAAEPAKAPAAPAQPTQAPAAKAEPAKAEAAPKQRYKLKYAWIPGAQAPLFMARDRGLYQALGLDIEFVRFNSGPAMFAALKSGDIDAADMSSITYLVGRSQGIDVKVFSLIYDLSTTNYLVVQPGITVNSARDLKDKKLASVQGSSSYYGLVTYLSQSGMTVNDIPYMNMDGAAITPAFVKKDVDAAWHWTPWYNKMAEAGGKLVVNLKDINAFGLEVQLARSDWLKSNQEAARLLIEAQERARVQMKADPSVAYDALADNLGTTKEMAKEIFQITPYPSVDEMTSKDSVYSILTGYQDSSAGVGQVFKKTADFELKEGIVKQAIPLKDTIDPGPMQAMMASKR